MGQRRRAPPGAGSGQHPSQDTGASEPPERGDRPEEHESAVAHRPVPAKVGGHRFADIGGQGEAVTPPPLPPHRQLSGPPVDVLQPHGHDLAAAQAQAGQQQQDGVVAPADALGSVAAAHYGGHVLGVDRPGQRGIPAGDGEDGPLQRDRGHPDEAQVAEERAQRRDGLAAGRETATHAHLGRERRDVVGAQLIEGDDGATPMLGDEQAGDVHIEACRALDQAALAPQVGAELLQEPLRLILGCRRRDRFERLDPGEVGDEGRQGLRGPEIGGPPLAPRFKERPDGRRRHGLDVQPLIVEPATQVREQVEVLLDG